MTKASFKHSMVKLRTRLLLSIQWFAGTGGESIYGGTFQAERSPRRRSGPSILMTLSQGGPDATGSQFVLCYRQSTDFEGDNTIFGRVIKGMDTVLELEMMGRGASVEIVDCGEVSGDYASESGSDKPSRFAVWRQKQEELSAAFVHNCLSHKVIDREATSKKPSSNPDEMSESHESNAEKSELKPAAEGLTNSSSYPHHRSDDTLKPRQEVFGPVAPVIRFKTEEEAIQIANDTNAGLAA